MTRSISEAGANCRIGAPRRKIAVLLFVVVVAAFVMAAVIISSVSAGPPSVTREDPAG